MANILLLDDNDVAGRAMQGILARGNHTCFVAGTTDEALRVLRESVVFDLVFLETKVGSGAGLAFLERLRDDWFWKILPVVVYTHDTDGKQVKRALGLSVQNYLIKPFNDQLIFTEIAKAMHNPWRNLHFEEAKSFCALMGLAPDALTQMRRDVMTRFDAAAKSFPAWAVDRKNEEVFAQTSALIADAEAAGVWAGVDYLRDLQEQAAIGNWGAFRSCAEYLDFASRLIFCQLNPSYVPDTLRSPEELAEAKEAAERARWLGADVERNGPLTSAEALCKEIDALDGCPVIDVVAAEFQMVADGRPARMSLAMDLVASDPALCAQVLAAANRVERDEMTTIEDARAAASLLGELKLHKLGRTLPLAAERHLNLPPLTWPNFRLFQVAVGRVAQFICSYLELSYLMGNAYTAGLLHDIGKLILLKLHPAALEAILRYAREQKVPLAIAERKYLGCTTRELAVHFAQANGLPAAYVDVMRWIEAPENAAENGDLVAIVALARHVCLHLHVGACGELGGRGHAEIASTPAWGVLQRQLFPSFELKKFEVQAHALCLTLRQELSGNRTQGRASHAQRAAELV